MKWFIPTFVPWLKVDVKHNYANIAHQDTSLQFPTWHAKEKEFQHLCMMTVLEKTHKHEATRDLQWFR